MFLALDESFGSTTTTIGCLVIPQDKLPELEAKFISLRQKYKLWAEIKWSRVSESCVDKYIEIIGSFLNEDGVTYHSWTYQNPNVLDIIRHYSNTDKHRIIYRHSYLLIRTVVWKHRNSGYKGSYYVLADESGKVGKDEYRITRELLQKDQKITPSLVLDFCATGNSLSCGAMQVSDLITGAVASKYPGKHSKSPSNEKIAKYLESLNSNFPINYHSNKFPNLTDRKLHHCLHESPRLLIQ